MEKSEFSSYRVWAFAIGTAVIKSLLTIPFIISSLMYVAFIEVYQISREEATIPVTVLTVVRCLAGPIVGILGEKFGLHKVTLLGCLLSVIGFGMCYFAENILTITFILGLVYGAGQALGTALLPMFVKRYCDGNVTSAMGLQTAGINIVNFAIPPIAIHLLQVYDLFGAIIIFSAIMLHSVPITMLLYTFGSRTALRTRNLEKKSIKYEGIETESPLQNENKVQAVRIPLSTKEYYEKNETQKLSLEQEDLLKSVGSVFQESCNTNNLENKLQNTSESREISERSCTKRGFALNSVEKPLTSALIEKKYTVRNNRSCMYYINVVKDPTYIVYMTINAVFAYVALLLWTTILDYSRDKGNASEYEVYILTIFPILTMIGSLEFGWVTDKGYMSIPNFLIVNYFLMGISSCWIVWSRTFEYMIAGTLIFALTTGTLTSVSPAVIFKFFEVGQQMFTIASLGLFYAPMSFTVYPLVGYFRGHLGSYDGVYYVMAAMCFVCCPLSCLLPIFSKARHSERHAVSSGGP